MKNSEQLIQRITALEEQIISGPNKPMNLMETAAYLGLSPSYIYKLTHKHLIPHYKPTGKRIYFFKKELDEWITSNEECRVKNEDDGSAALTTKDPQQIELKLNEKKSK